MPLDLGMLGSATVIGLGLAIHVAHRHLLYCARLRTAIERRLERQRGDIGVTGVWSFHRRTAGSA
jgi:hypothetical protein